MTRSRSYLSWGVLGVLVLVVLLLSVGGPAGAAVDEAGMPPTPPPEVAISQAEQDRVRDMILTLETEALQRMNVPEYHTQNVKGAGVSIAVLDVGYAELQTRIDEGELPADLVRKTYDGKVAETDPLHALTDGVSDSNDDPNSPCYAPQPHGTAVAEIVHDIAPEANLYVVQLKNTNATNMQSLLAYLRDEGVRIVSASLGWPIWRGNGTGPGYDLFQTARRDYDLLFIESAGNQARTFYSAVYTDDDNDGLHEFKPGWLGTTIREDEQNGLQVGRCRQLSVFLEWDDWGNDPQNPSPAITYDIILADENGKEVARGQPSDWPGMNDAPYRWFNFSLPADVASPSDYELEIHGPSGNGTNRRLRLMVWGTHRDGPLEQATATGSLSAYGDAADVFSVGAANVQDGKLEYYSSRGPTTDNRIKPDITGYARVRNATYSDKNGFPGTSAAAPHVAGAATLLLQTHPGATADQLAQMLEDAAEERGSPGKDTQWGAGLVRLPALQTNVAILAPTTTAPDYVGDPAAPVKTLIDVTVTTGAGTQWAGLGASDFDVQVNGRTATVTTARLLSDRYLLEIMPPTQSAAGIFDLRVTVQHASATQPQAMRYAGLGANRVDVMLILDRSGSMAGQPLVDARNASILFVDLMSQGDAVGVGSYSSSSRLDYQLTPITDATIKAAAANAIRGINSGGNTSIGAGLITGRDQLLAGGDDNHAWAIVLLSDGRENTSPGITSVLPSIASTKIKVFSIGLGDVDENKMSLIATETGGNYYLTPNSSELGAIYNSIAGQVAGRQTLFAVDGAVSAGQTVTHQVDVDPAVSEAVFSVSWNSGGSDLNLVLFQPNGRRIDDTAAASDPAIDLVSGDTYRYYVVRNPAAGRWRLAVTGITTSAVSRRIDSSGAEVAGEAFILSVQAQTNLTLELNAGETHYAAGDPIHLLLSLAGARPLTGADVVADVTRPDGTTEQLRLLDDGNHGDNVADDGVYGAHYYHTDRPGTYRFDVTADGQANNRPFKRVAELAVVVSAATDADRDGMPDEWEYWGGLDPLRNDAAEDLDQDGLTNLDEFRHGGEPQNPDTDADRLLDGEEVNTYHTDPRRADTDLGGTSDGDELKRGTNPLDRGDDAGPGVAILPMVFNIPHVSSDRPLLNGNFEGGPTGWTEYSRQGLHIIYNRDEVEGLPVHGGRWVAWLGGYLDEVSYIEQEVTVPADRPYLAYYQAIASDDDCGHDFGGVLIDDHVVDSYELCRPNNTANWARNVVDLRAYAGQTVRLQIRAETNGSRNSNLFIDDVSFSNTAAVREGETDIPPFTVQK